MNKLYVAMYFIEIDIDYFSGQSKNGRSIRNQIPKDIARTTIAHKLHLVSKVRSYFFLKSRILCIYLHMCLICDICVFVYHLALINMFRVFKWYFHIACIRMFDNTFSETEKPLYIHSHHD